MVVRPDDPLGYAKLIARIASYEDALLVDPYLEIEALAIVANGTSIGRVLTSKKDQARVAAIIAAAQTDALPNTIDIRFSSELHDRYVIPPTGPIEHLGTSLNGASKHVSVSTPLREPVASEIRRLMEGIWERAEKMKIPKAKGARIAAGLAAGAGVTATDSVDGADALAADIAPTADPGSARED